MTEHIELGVVLVHTGAGTSSSENTVIQAGDVVHDELAFS